MRDATRWSRRRFLGAAATSAVLAGCLDRGPSPSEQVQARKDELDRFRDVGTAISEGYQTAGRYVVTDDGALGIPFVNPQVETLDETRPNAVLYALTNEGTYEPIGFKWFAPASDHDSAPSLFGRTFDGPIAGEIDAIPKHYALHVWLFEENPDGLFALYNPALEPTALVEEIRPVRETLRQYRLGSKAQDAGYRNTEKCVPGYGVPFVKEGNGGQGGTDPTSPPVLVYRVTANWTYWLVGAEWYVPTAETDSPPTMFGQRFHDPREGHSPKTDQPSHYGLHAWLFYANSNGMFEPRNPAVSC